MVVEHVRSIETVSPSRRDEISSVVRLALAIILCAWIYAGSRSPEADATRGLVAYQTLMQDLPSVEQRTFREIQEGLVEAERVRATSGRWPAPAALAADGIPPFARDPTTKGSAYTWRTIERGATINYLGIPAEQAAAWLLLIQEPEPGSPPDRAPDDEEHHRLPDGTVLHVSIWKHGDGTAVPAALTPLPQARGWVQILGRAPTAVVK